MSLAERSMFSGERLRAVFAPHAAKKVGRRFRIATATAKLWLSRGVPESRHQEVAGALIEEIDRQAADRARWRAELEAIRGDCLASDFTIGAAAACGGAALPRGAAR